MSTVLLYSLLTTALYYLLARAQITEALWSRYPYWFDYWTSCAACSGTWYGFIVAWAFKKEFLGLPGDHWTTIIVVGLCSMIWTPLVSHLHVQALVKLQLKEDYDDTTPIPEAK